MYAFLIQPFCPAENQKHAPRAARIISSADPALARTFGFAGIDRIKLFSTCILQSP